VAVHGELGRAPADPSAAASARPAGTAGTGARQGTEPRSSAAGEAAGLARRAEGSGHGRAYCASTPTRGSASLTSLFGTTQLSISAHFLQGQVLSASRGATTPTPAPASRWDPAGCDLRAWGCAGRLSRASSRSSVSCATLPGSLF
jgi:hypothetical protein